MPNGLQYQTGNKGEIETGNKNKTISVNDDLWNEFCSIIVKKQGNRQVSGVLEELIKDYIKKNGGGE
jgi:predicted CopG family antitoxin